jgi:hypothetical protein
MGVPWPRFCNELEHIQNDRDALGDAVVSFLSEAAVMVIESVFMRFIPLPCGLSVVVGWLKKNRVPVYEFSALTSHARTLVYK